MMKTFHELDFLGAAVSLLRRTHGSPGENRGDGHRFESSHGGTHHGRFAFYLEYRVLRQGQRHSCAFGAISARMDFPGAVWRRDGSFVALLLSSAPTRRDFAGGSG